MRLIFDWFCTVLFLNSCVPAQSPDLAMIQQRIKEVLQVLGDFNARREEGKYVSIYLHMDHILRKPFFCVSDQIRHKLGCTITEGGLKFRILMYYLHVCSENKGADQLRIYSEVDLIFDVIT